MLDAEFKKMRDDSVERNLLLKQKNQSLLEKQNYEIYNAVLKERNRIAREIHDNTGHMLSRSILLTGAAKAINKEEGLTPLLSQLEETLNTAMTDIRKSVHDLHDESVNLKETLDNLIESFSFCPAVMEYDMGFQIPQAVRYGFIAIIREDLITDDVLPGTPTMLKWKTQADADSLYNTPPCYNIYICGKVFKWIKKMGGLSAMKEHNEKKAEILYDFLDESKMFKGTVVKEDRSLMNVPFVTGDKELDAKFVKEAEAAGFVNLKGHRTVGGMRASIYNAMPIEGVEKLVEFMKKFEKENA